MFRGIITAALFAAVPMQAVPAQPVQSATSQDSAWLNRQLLALYERDYRAGWNVTPSGLRWRRVKGDGSGRHPVATDTVMIHYAGMFIDASEFDSSYARGKPATFPLARLIAGWQEGVPHAGIGDTIELAVPATLGYGLNGKGPIPGGATLLFTIELIDIVSGDPVPE